MSTQDPNQPMHSDYDEKVSVVSEHAATAASREQPDPKVGLEPASLWTFFIACIALVIGAGYLGGVNGGWSNDSYTFVEGYVVPPEEGGVVKGPSRTPGEQWLYDGKKQYSAICAACHQSNGKGQAGLFPPLVNSDYVHGGTEQLAAILLNGMNGPIMVDGSSYNGNMQAWDSALTDKQIAQIMSYVLTEPVWGNDTRLADGDNGMVSAEMVAVAREKHKIPGLTVADLVGIEGNLPGGPLDPETMEPLGGTIE